MDASAWSVAFQYPLLDRSVIRMAGSMTDARTMPSFSIHYWIVR